MSSCVLLALYQFFLPPSLPFSAFNVSFSLSLLPLSRSFPLKQRLNASFPPPPHPDRQSDKQTLSRSGIGATFLAILAYLHKYFSSLERKRGEREREEKKDINYCPGPGMPTLRFLSPSFSPYSLSLSLSFSLSRVPGNKPTREPCSSFPYHKTLVPCMRRAHSLFPSSSLSPLLPSVTFTPLMIMSPRKRTLCREGEKMLNALGSSNISLFRRQTLSLPIFFSFSLSLLSPLPPSLSLFPPCHPILAYTSPLPLLLLLSLLSLLSQFVLAEQPDDREHF